MELPPDILAAHPDWAAILNGAPAPGGVSGGVSGGAPPMPAMPGGGMPAPGGAQPMPPGGSPIVADWNATQALIGANTNLQNQQGALATLKETQQIPAAANLLDARATQNTAGSAFLQEQQRANEALRANQLLLKDASQNTGNILTVARAQAERNAANKYTYQLAGLTAPIEVELPENYAGPIPPGVVARLQTLAERIQDKNADEEAMWRFRTEAARIKYAETGIKVTEADIAAGRVGLTLDQAELAVERARIGVAAAQNALTASHEPPAPGLEWDDVTSEWVPSVTLKQRQATRAEQEKDAKAREALTKDGIYGTFSEAELVDFASKGVIATSTFSDELTRRGYLPGTIDALLRLIAIRQQTGDGDDDMPAYSGATGATTTTPAAPTAPGLNFGAAADPWADSTPSSAGATASQSPLSPSWFDNN